MVDKNLKLALIDEALGLPKMVEDYTYDDAIRITELAIKTKDAAFLHFNLACFYSAIDKLEEAMCSLNRALEKGYSDWSNVTNDPSLFNLRRTDEFWKVISKYVGNEKETK